MSLTVILIAGGITATILQDGFNLGIDFKAGMSMRVKIDASDISTADMREVLGDIDGTQIQSIGTADTSEFIIKVPETEGTDNFSAQMSARIEEDLGSAFGAGKIQVLQTDYVGPSFSQQLASQTFLLGSFALALILVYVWFRFKFAFAISAIAALVHDVLFMLGVIGAFQMEVSTATIAAVLTIIGYSLNDTIVIFDRVRENLHIMREKDVEKVVNTSISQSLSRTLVTSLTTLLAVGAIFIFGSGAIKSFALNLIIGIFVGTYSSIFIASPIFLALGKLGKKRRAAGGSAVSGKSDTAAKLEPAVNSLDEDEIKKAAEEEKSRIISLEERQKDDKGKRKSRAQRKKKK